MSINTGISNEQCWCKLNRNTQDVGTGIAFQALWPFITIPCHLSCLGPPSSLTRVTSKFFPLICWGTSVYFKVFWDSYLFLQMDYQRISKNFTVLLLWLESWIICPLSHGTWSGHFSSSLQVFPPWIMESLLYLFLKLIFICDFIVTFLKLSWYSQIFLFS